MAAASPQEPSSPLRGAAPLQAAAQGLLGAPISSLPWEWSLSPLRQLSSRWGSGGRPWLTPPWHGGKSGASVQLPLPSCHLSVPPVPRPSVGVSPPSLALAAPSNGLAGHQVSPQP